MAFNTGNDPYEVGSVTQEFTSRIEVLLQQKPSLLRMCVDVGTHVGKGASPINQVGVLAPSAPGARGSPLVPIIPLMTRRWVFPNDRHLPVQIDTFDELRTIVDMKGGIAESAMAGFNRYHDDLIINAATATATTGPDSSNFATESFASTASTSGGYVVADTFGASASTGMTWPKIVEMTRVMRHAQVPLDEEDPYLIIGSQQEADLSKQMEVINRDYGVAVMRDGGSITKIGKYNTIVSERLNTSSSSTLRNCLGFVRSGIHLGIWSDTQVRIDNRVDLVSTPWQLYAKLTAGATRTQLFKVVQVNCADTSGADPTAP